MTFWKRTRWAAAVVVVLAIPGVAWWQWPTRLPHPNSCSRNQLYAWIALRDLQDEPMEVRRALVRRFEELLVTDGISEPIDVDPKYQPMVDVNRRLLQDLWFFDCVDKYYAMAPIERGSYLDQQLRIALNWQSMTKDTNQNSDPNRPSAISQAAAGWIERSAAQDRPHTIGVLGAATLRWLATFDLSGFPPNSRERIATEIFAQMQHEETAQAIPTSREDMGQIIPEDSELLRQNAQLLLRAWFLKQARLYHAQDDSSRLAFVRDQVATVRNSPLLTLVFSSNSAGGAPNPILLMMKVQQTIGQWIREADEEDKGKLQAFSTAVFGELIRSGLTPGKRAS